MVTVYTTPNCVQCEQTKKWLDRNDVKYSVVDLSKDAAAYDKVTAMGYKAAPVVEGPHGTWSGFRLDLLAGLKEAHH